MLSKTFILAAAASGLMAGAAFAQDNAQSYPNKASTPLDQIQNSPNSPHTVNPPVATSAQSSSNQTNVSATTTLPSGATIINEEVTNGPVPDTRANREKFGGPDSRAGRLTRAAGN